jgi:hypothetical protein
VLLDEGVDAGLDGRHLFFEVLKTMKTLDFFIPFQATSKVLCFCKFLFLNFYFLVCSSHSECLHFQHQ